MNNSKLDKSFSIKIPNKMFLYYTKTFLVIKTFLGIRFMKLNTEIKFCHKNKLIFITNVPLNNILNKKNLIIYQQTFKILLKKSLKELKKKITKKLKLVGVGFRAHAIKHYGNNILQLKLGFSHNLFFFLPKNLKIICPKYNKILIYGHSETTVNNFVSLLRSYKYPDVYKGKGVLYEKEKLKLKEGKKV